MNPEIKEEFKLTPNCYSTVYIVCVPFYLAVLEAPIYNLLFFNIREYEKIKMIWFFIFINLVDFFLIIFT